MGKSINRIHYFLLMLLVVSLVTAGCGSSNKEDKAPTNSTSEGKSSSDNAGAADDSKLSPYNIVMVFPGPEPKDQKLVQDEINKILQKKINATLEIRSIDWSAWGDKTNLMFASDDPFDLMFSAGWFGFTQQVAKGQFIPLDDLVAKYGQDFTKTIDPEIVNAAKVNGKLYGMVANKEFAADKGLILRKDLVDKYKFDLSKVKELADMEPLFKTIKENEPGVTPFITTGGASPSAMILDYGYYDMLGEGPGELTRSGAGLKVINKIEDPKYMEYAKLMRKWYQAGYINKDAATLQDIGKSLGAGKAFAQTGSFKPGSNLDNSRTQGTELVEIQLAKPFTSTTDATSAVLAISRTSKDPERAMMFANLLYTDKDIMNLLINGIEGKHYVIKSDNVIDFPAGVDSNSSGYPPTRNWMLGNLPLVHLWASEDPNKWEAYANYNKSAEKSRALGFAFNAEPVKTEIAATSNVEKEFKNVIVTGSVDPEKYIPDYITKLKAAGMDKIIAEKQKQLDEWAKAN
ncbi:ABC transporter substrate-binding protein [Paenibacillus baekrokdamisoli]|uniref:ABC transporter substrate-binding protein n=1 Tax=Paenibacillus baekrokdamisoli TaxID=1712516 RepID=A0A3G9JE84_9BACL|nr:ABC transporter substrate-binding protein [Paenibacillus baekrokdamisoli]MBB3070294.1 putative aldouronate transport system substrate-binding protein [Paenibacillus baekrokdamisoli]BBH21299.1 ABC transporter substrate-binding protein [Paenibacillus baekrokdamisoli]